VQAMMHGEHVGDSLMLVQQKVISSSGQLAALDFLAAHLQEDSVSSSALELNTSSIGSPDQQMWIDDGNLCQLKLLRGFVDLASFNDVRALKVFATLH
jgi:hypothetical protein